MKKGQVHPAALTSKRMISAALIEMIEKKDFKSITITELCTAAQIARRTFYRNFVSTDEVLAFHVENINGEFIVEMKKHENESFYNILVSFFKFWLSYSELLKLLNRNGLTYIIFTEYIKSLEQIPFICGLKPSDLKPDEFALRFAFVTGGLWSLLTFYMVSGSTKSPQELAGIMVAQLA